MSRSSLRHALSVAVCALLIFALSIAMPLSEKNEFSERENRALSLFPTLSIKSLASGDFSRRLSDFYSDQFPLRSLWLSLKASIERLMGAQELGGILLGKDGYLIPRNEYDDLLVARNNLTACRAFLDRMTDAGIPTTVAIAPRPIDALSAYLPALYDPTRASAIYGPIHNTLPEAVDLTTPLREAADGGASVFYHTDHHWTTDGAYLSYTKLAPALGIEPLPKEDFSRVTMSHDFLGTSYSATGLLSWDTPDQIVLYRYEGDARMTVCVVETGEAFSGFYREEYLEQKDQYRIFLGGNYAHLSIRNPDVPELPTLLLIKDSFSNSLIPFLSRHFQLEVIDPRYVTESVAEQIIALSPDQVLLLWGADTLATNPSLRKLN